MILQAEIHAFNFFVITVNTTAGDAPSKFKEHRVPWGKSLQDDLRFLKETEEVGEKRASLFRSVSFVIGVDPTC